MTLLGVVVLFVGLVVAGIGAGLALFERLPAPRTLRLMAIGTAVGTVGLVVTLISADDGESLGAGALVPLAIVIAIVAYAAWFARRPPSPDAPADPAPTEPPTNPRD